MAKRKTTRRTKSPASETALASPPVRPSTRRLWGFRIAALIVAPALLLGLLELILRAAGSGYPTSFLLPASHKGQDVFVQNNQFGRRFFGPAMARLPHPICIPQSPPRDSIRIIVLGESAAKGDPDPDFGLARMLDAMLSLRHAGIDFEVVNTAVTAINSHAVLPIARDCADAGADVWVIYLGNNEVVGPFGAGTVFGQQTPPLGIIRASLALKTTRTGQLLDAWIGQPSSQSAANPDWQGMQMFLEQQVRADDPRMRGVYRHFERNLADILHVGRRNNAGIVLSTVPVNLRDCPPFASAHRVGITTKETTRWDTLYQLGIQALDSGHNQEAAEQFAEAATLDSSFAELRFRQGQCALALGNDSDAQRHFREARDSDVLRFRCDNRMNAIIRERAADLESGGILLADAEQVFAEHSADGLPGETHFYEHVHLTFEGNWLLARTIAAQVETLLTGRLSTAADPSASWPSVEDCAHRLGWSDWSQLKGWRGILPRLSRPPFTQQFDHQTRMQHAQSQLATLASATTPSGLGNALQACEGALASAPDDPALRRQQATLKRALGDHAGALAAAKRAVDLIPSDANGWSKLALALARQRQFTEAIAAFENAVQLNPRDAVAIEGLAQTKAAAGRRDEAVADFRQLLKTRPGLGLAWLHYGQLLEGMGRTTEAADCFDEALANPGKNPAGLKELAAFCQNRGWFGPAAQNYVEALKTDPGNAELHVGAAQNLAALGQLDTAVLHAAEAVRLAPEFAEARLLHGVILGRQGMTTLAVEEFQEALRLKPSLLDARLNLGIAMLKTDPVDALRHFEAVLQQDPSHSAARRYAQQLQSRGTIETAP